MKYSKTEQTRQHIIASTAPIFNRKGYAGTSVTDITQASKLTSGSIYGNFKNKEEVALAAFDYNLAKVKETVAQAVDCCKSTPDKLRMYIKAYHSTQKLNFPGGGCPMQNTITDADDTFQVLHKRAADGLLNWKKDLISIIDKGIQEKVFYADTNSNKTAMHIMALIEFGFLMGSATRSRAQVDELLDMASEIAEKIIR